MLSPSKVNLNNVSVAAPCRLAWDEMEGDDRVRFCTGCKLNVYNISEMTRKEAEEFLQTNADGQLCLRLYRRADGTLITKDCPVGRKIVDGIKRRTRGLTIAIVAAFNATVAFAQQRTMSYEEAVKLLSTLRAEGPRDTNLFQVDPLVVDGRPWMRRDVAPTVTDSTTHGADTSAMNAFFDAQQYAASKEISKAFASYEIALKSFRESKANYDPQFVRNVSSGYVRLLRQQKDTAKAKLIEEEFCSKK